jgi:hypothetical protein
MTITQEMQDILMKLKYDDNEKFDVVLYMICKKIYQKEKWNYKDFVHIRTLSNRRGNELLNYINLCNLDNNFLA